MFSQIKRFLNRDSLKAAAFTSGFVCTLSTPQFVLDHPIISGMFGTTLGYFYMSLVESIHNEIPIASVVLTPLLIGSATYQFSKFMMGTNKSTRVFNNDNNNNNNNNN